jgi:hypothetical protein
MDYTLSVFKNEANLQGNIHYSDVNRDELAKKLDTPSNDKAVLVSLLSKGPQKADS